MKKLFHLLNRTTSTPALVLTILLQTLPYVRTVAVVYESLAPAFAIILRLTAFSTATMGGLNAVSGATQIDQPPAPYIMRLTNGVAFFQPLHVSGQTATYWILSPKPSWMNINGVNGSAVWSLSGTPTLTGVTTHTLTAKENQTVTDPERSMSVTMTITVVNSGGGTAPAISNPPASQTSYVGSSANLTVTASSGSPMTYQWRKGGINVGVNNPTLTLNPISAGNAGSYDVIVSNSTGTVTSTPPAVLTVIQPPTLQLHLNAAQPITGPRAISWPALAGKSYFLQRRDSFTPDVWHDLGQTNVTVTGPVQITDDTAGNVSARFYQIRIQ